MTDLPMIEHGSTRTGRWLRERRLRIALWIALIEGILVVLHAVPRWPSIFVAAIVVVIYLAWGRHARSDTVRHTSWILAASQALVALVPIIFIVVGTVALIVVAILAVLALVVLFTERS